MNLDKNTKNMGQQCCQKYKDSGNAALVISPLNLQGPTFVRLTLLKHSGLFFLNHFSPQYLITTLAMETETPATSCVRQRRLLSRQDGWGVRKGFGWWPSRWRAGSRWSGLPSVSTRTGTVSTCLHVTGMDMMFCQTCQVIFKCMQEFLHAELLPYHPHHYIHGHS